jgi:photosystem II stability/assembly factor-like uncharacterized protein
MSEFKKPFSPSKRSQPRPRLGQVFPPRPFWFVSALVLFLACSFIALQQSPDPSTGHRRSRIEWWLRPVEMNADQHLLRAWGDLTDISVVRGAGHVWVVGRGGLILHSADYGAHWIQQHLLPNPASPTQAATLPKLGAPWQPLAAFTLLGLLPSPETPTHVGPDERPSPRQAVKPSQPAPKSFGSTEQKQQQPVAQEPRATRSPVSPKKGKRRGSSATGTTTPVESPPLPKKPTEVPLQELAAADLRSVYFVDAKFGWVAGTRGALFATQDGGTTWVRQSAGTDLLFSVAFVDRSDGWAASSFDTWRTLDGGRTWKSVRVPDLLLGFFEVCANRKIVCALAELDSAVFCTSDQGVKWTESVIGSTPTGISLSGATPWVVTASGEVYTKTGNEVTKVYSTHDQKQILHGVDFPDPRFGYAVGNRGFLIRTRDGGRTWHPVKPAADADLRAVRFSDRRHGWIVGDTGTLLGTADGGETWHSETRPIPPEALWDPAKRRALLAAEAHRRYRIFPAPWYYLSLLLVGLVLAPALKRPRPQIAPERTIADRLISDRPIQAGTPDVFDFGSVALGLSRFLRNEKTLPPLTLAVTGEWGSGKSSLMNLLKADLERYGFQPVWFNAWHHQKEEHLLASLLATIRAQALPPWWRPEGMLFRAKLLRIRWARYWPLLILLLIPFSISLGYVCTHPEQLSHALDALGKLDPKDTESWVDKWFLQPLTTVAHGTVTTLLVSLVGLLVSIWRGAKGFGVNPASLLARDSGNLKDLSALTGFRQQFATEFEDITGALNPRTMLILIDDLDRCRPEMVLEVLEAVNFLVSSGDCFVVMGMARERVVRCVGLSFKDVASELLDPATTQAAGLSPEDLARQRRLEFARQYLEKLINIEVPVPLPTEEQSRRLMIASEEEEFPPAGRNQRFLRWARTFARRAVPVAALVALLGLSFWLGATRPGEIQNATSGGAPTASTAGQLSSNPASYSGVAATSPGAAAPPTSTQGPVQVDPGEDARWSRWMLYGLAGLSVLLVGFGIWRLSIPPDVIVRDSEEFEKALSAWHPLIVAARNTPRAIKRFLNRVRYLAMLQRRQSPEPTRWQRLLSWFRSLRGGAESATADTDPAPLIPEGALVALAAIEHCHPDWLGDDRLFRDSERLVAELPAAEKQLWSARLAASRLGKYRELYLQMARGVHVS